MEVDSAGAADRQVGRARAQLAMGGPNSAVGSATNSTQGKGNGAELSPNEYGYTALPGGAGRDGSAGTVGSRGGSTALGPAGNFAGPAGSTAGGAASSSGGDASSGGSTMQLGGSSGQASQMAGGMPSVSFDMAQQQNPQQYDPRLEQQPSRSSQRNSSLSTAQLRGHNWALR